MKMRLNRILLTALLLVVIGCVFPVTSHAMGGSCGKNVTWDLTGSTLTISGTGKMYDYEGSWDVPWRDYYLTVKRIVIQPGVTHLGNYAFHFWFLEDVSIPDTVTSIGDWCFSCCGESFKTITLPKNLKTIGHGCFYRSYDLENVSIPSSVTSIGGYAFGETKIKNITIPSKVTSIPAGCFVGCPELTKVTFASGTTLKAIDNAAFEGCTKLSGITLPSSVETIGERAFANCTGFTKFTIPSSVKSISKNAFLDCTNLTTVTISKSAEGIDGSAFIGCKKLKTFSVSSSSKYYTGMNGMLLSKDKSLLVAYPTASGEITIPAGIERVGSYCFANTPITKITFPSSVVSLESYCFTKTKLKTVSIPASVEYIGEGAFSENPQLTKITLKKGNSRIFDSACFARTGITEIVIPEGTFEVANAVFAECEKLQRVSIPADLTLLSGTAFIGDSALCTIEIAAGNPVYTYKDNLLIDWESASVLWISPAASGSIVFPNGIRHISPACTLYAATSATFSATLETFGFDMFSHPEKEVTYTFLGSAPEVTHSYFFGARVLDNTTVCYPSDTAGWEEFKQYLEQYSNRFTWKKIKTLAYNANGGTGGPVGKTITSGTYTLSSDKPTRTGYNFLGWATSKSATKATYQPGDKVKLSGSKTFYAVWKIKTYTVKYNANGGSDAPSSQTKTYGKALTLRSGTPTRTGYIFQGWATSKDGSVKYQPKESYEVNSSQTLYAVWKAKTYKLSYDANGGTGAPSSQTKTYGKTLTLRTGVPTRKGYTFLGWATSKDGSVKYQPGDSYTANGTNTLYAKWKLNRYTIKFNGNGKTSGTMSSLTDRKYGTTYTLPANTYKRTGYYFIGWNTKADGSGAQYENKDSVKNLSTKDGGSVTLYAQWEIKTYDIRLSDSSCTAYLVKEYGKSVTLPSEACPAEGHVFVGWADMANTVYYEPGASYTKNAGIELYAKYKPAKYSIYFDHLDVCWGHTEPMLDLNYLESYTIPECGTPKTGFTLTEWNTKEDGTGDSFYPGDVITRPELHDGTSITLYPQWRANHYSIQFNGNGQTSGTMSGMNDLIYDTYYTLNANTYTRTGYNFVGWNTEADGSGRPLDDSEVVAYLSAAVDDFAGDGITVTLYAQWDIIKYTITIENSMEWGYPIELTKEYGQSIRLPAEMPDYGEYCFTGWSTAIDGSIVYQLNDEYTMDADITLYSQWTQKRYNVHFDGNGATSGSMPDVNDVSSSFYIPGCLFERTGYAFVSWNTHPDGSGTSYSPCLYAPGYERLENGGVFTLYAIWEKTDGFTITFDSGMGEGGPGSMMKRWGEALTIPEEIPTFREVPFLGWVTAPDASVPEYLPGDLYSSDAFRTLYAVWAPVTYTLRFNGNGADSGEMADLTGCRYAAEITLPKNQFEKTGCKFLHWDGEPECYGMGIEDGGSYQSLWWSDGETFELYAHWVPNE